MNRKPFAFAAGLLLMLSLLAAPARADDGCVSCPTLKDGLGLNPSQSIEVRIDPGFSAAQRQAIIDAFQAWEDASSGTNGIHYSFSSEPPSPVAQNGQWNVFLGGTFDPNEYGRTGVRSTGATSYLRAEVSLPLALGQLMAHEIGHGMGLDDCKLCCAHTTTMRTPPLSASFNDTSGSATPSSCDLSVSAKRYETKTDLHTTPPTGSTTGSGGGGGSPVQEDNAKTCTDWYLYTWHLEGGKWVLYDSEWVGCW